MEWAQSGDSFERMTRPRLPLVGLPADTADLDGLVFHSAGDKYVRAVAEVARCNAVVIPSIGEGQLDALLDHLSGVMLTGALSNVHPPHYGADALPDHEPYDQARDATTLALIRKVLARGMPLLCICRGFQELNVALGGTLEGEVQRGGGRLDHRAPKLAELDQRYGPLHNIDITPGGRLEAIMGSRRIRVNSLHRQAVARLAEGLIVEALAPDGVVEAASVKGAAGFALGVQWHPEYKAAANPDSVKLFEAFGDAARQYAGLRAEAPQAFAREREKEVSSPSRAAPPGS
jgi:putative glutamine amidotransferase